MTPTLQAPTCAEHQLDFLLAMFRPLLTTEEAAFLLDGCSHDHVHHLVDDGTLRAVDIRSPGALHRALRVYRYTVEHLLIRPRLPLARIGAETILQHSRPTWLLHEVASVLNCTTAHVRHLALDGPNIASASASRAMPRIHRAALVEFITTREIE